MYILFSRLECPLPNVCVMMHLKARLDCSAFFREAALRALLSVDAVLHARSGWGTPFGNRFWVGRLLNGIVHAHRSAAAFPRVVIYYEPLSSQHRSNQLHVLTQPILHQRGWGILPSTMSSGPRYCRMLEFLLL